MEYRLTKELILQYREHLKREERSEATIEKYMHNLHQFTEWSDGKIITKEIVRAWKENLIQSGCAAVTVNAALAALHGFFSYVGWGECRVKYLKIQRQIFRDVSKELNKSEFLRLVNCARERGNTKIALVMETIGATGIRVSEVRYITVEAVKRGRAEIFLKGKIRTILIPNKLAKKLKDYSKKEKIACGEIFRTASGNSLSRKQIWSEMKKLCKFAGVEESKVFPHNLRHLFARAFYKICQDIVQLADVLGHSSIETTRIYLITTGFEYEKQLDKLRLIS